MTPLHQPAPASAFRLLLRALTRNKTRLAGYFALLSVWQLCEAMVPVLIGVIIEQAVTGSDVSALLGWGAALVALFGCLSYAYRYGARLGFGTMQTEMHRMRVEIAEHALDARGARTSMLAGETLSLATSDVETVGYLIRAAGYAVASFAALVVTAWVLLDINLTLGLVVLLGVPLVLLVVQVLTPVISRRSSDQQERIARASGVATDLVQGLRTIKGIGAEDVATARYRTHSQRAATASIRAADSYGAMLGLTTGLSGLFLALVALLAGRLALEGIISVGELIAIVGLTQFLAEPITVLGELSALMARSHASARRIVAFLHTPRLVAAGDRTPGSAIPRLVLRSVTAGTADGLSLESRPGELLALVVDDPATAATVVRLLGGEVPPAERTGELLLDGVPFEELSVDGRRDRLVVNPHHVDLFEGTLRTNIDPGGRADDRSLDRLLEASAAADVVALHEEGLEAEVRPDGSTLSGGQRQRVALARALVAGVPMLVLHDPTTAVDAVTEQRIAEGLRETRHLPGSSCTTWVITSSPAFLAQADRVVVVREGRVVAEGTHAALVADAGYRAQVLR